MVTSEYEMARNRRIAENMEQMRQLGIESAAQEFASACKKEKKSSTPREPKPDWMLEPSRRSDRAASMPKVNYNEVAIEGETREYTKKRKRTPTPSCETLPLTSADMQERARVFCGGPSRPWLSM